MTLGKAVKLWHTPTMHDYKAGASDTVRHASLAAEVNRQKEAATVGSGQLNPAWVEWLMGFPIGWTELNDSETQSYRNGRKLSGKQSKKPKGGTE